MAERDPVEVNSVLDNHWGSVLAELQGDGQADGVKGLDRLASLDLVSDLLMSEGFEGFENPGSEERKLTRLASLELLTELFEGEGTLPEATRFEEASGATENWTDEDLLEALGVTGGEDASGENLDGSRTPELVWGPAGAFEPFQPEVGALNEESAAFQRSAPQMQQNQNYSVAWSTGVRPASGVVPPFSLQNDFSMSFDQGAVQGEDGPPQNPRIRFTPRQQKALYRFGAKMNWMAAGVENSRDAHKLCTDIGIGIRQLKKWISNHRPKELRLPVTHPPWCTAPTNFGSGPPLSQAAIASLAAAQAAVLGQPFAGPFDAPPPPSTPYLAGGGSMPQMQLPSIPSFQGDGRLAFAGGSGSSIGSMGSQIEGEGLAHPFDKGSNPESMKKVLRRKLKDFEPGKVQKLFQLCVEYRQKRRDRVQLGGDLLEALESPRKKQRTDVFSQGGPFTSHLEPPLTPTPPAPQLKKLPSESGEDSDVTDGEKPSEVPPSEDSGDPLASAGSLEAGWQTKGNQLRPLPSFPSIDLSQFGFDQSDQAQLSPAVDDTQAEVNRAGARLHRALSISSPPPNPLLPLPSNPLLNPPFSPTHLSPVLPLGLHNPPINPQFNPLGVPKRPLSRSGREKSLPPTEWPQQLPGCTFLFEKVLTASDTSPLGRIIIPKVQAEAHLPKMLGKESCTLAIRDAIGRTWELRYRFWFNNKSRIYVLEHAADLILSRGLLPGHSIAFYRSECDGSLVMLDRRDHLGENEGAIRSVSPSQLGADTLGKAPGGAEYGF